MRTISMKKGKERTSMRKKILYILITIIIGLLVSGCSNKPENPDNLDASSLPIENVTASYLIDMDDPQIVAGFADYLFVGRVDELVNTEYLPYIWKCKFRKFIR